LLAIVSPALARCLISGRLDSPAIGLIVPAGADMASGRDSGERVPSDSGPPP